MKTDTATASQKLIKKIRALRAKRVEAGATEAEAEAAADLAARLMAQYQIGAEDLAGPDYDRLLLPVKGIGLNPAKSHPCVFVGPPVRVRWPGGGAHHGLRDIPVAARALCRR